MNAAVEMARLAGADESNPDNALTWQQRMEITRKTLEQVIIPYLQGQTMFVVRVPGLPFIKRRVTWGWLRKPIQMLFEKAIKDMTPVEVATDAP
jgi:hypothetical protein